MALSATANLRRTEYLDGIWDFAFLGKVDLATVDPATFTTPERMPVPSAFDALPAYAGKRGAALYHRQFNLPVGSRARLDFMAVSMWCRIFIDGKPLRDHACGYSPFSVDVPPANVAKREVVVLVDNRFDFERIPMHEEYFDFYQYGGIIRSVLLQILPEGGYIDSVHVTPHPVNYAAGEVQVDVSLADETRSAVELKFQFDETEPEVFTAVPVIDNVARVNLRVPQPQTWSPNTPHLHRLYVILCNTEHDDVDDQHVRFGLRRIEAHDGALWLNGEKLQLRGYNRHEWHPNYGPSTPELQMHADIQLLRDLGCNFVRGSHYPQDQRFLDLCDEFGLLVWEENLGWGQSEKTFVSAKWNVDHAEALKAMVRASFNHPSIIMWGFLNESRTNEAYLRPVFEATIKSLRAWDPSRLITYGSMFATTDLYFDLVDLISINIYPGWYGCSGVENPVGLIRPKMQECFDSIDGRGLSDKPIIISEIGAEGLYAWRDAHHDFFTEEYQAKYLQEACAAALEHPRCSGIALWHFSDVRTYSGGWSLLRPRTFNNKGTLDEYRRPKAAYAVVREQFRSHTRS